MFCRGPRFLFVLDILVTVRKVESALLITIDRSSVLRREIENFTVTIYLLVLSVILTSSNSHQLRSLIHEFEEVEARCKNRHILQAARYLHLIL